MVAVLVGIDAVMGMSIDRLDRLHDRLNEL
jgi:hypothetical protein